MPVAHIRHLGEEAGVQLNPLQDNSVIPLQGNADQSFGIMMRSLRGRFDKPFKVGRGDFTNKLGKGERRSLSELNEAWVHVYEALNNGAYEAVVQRLVPENTLLKYIVCYVGDGAELTAVVTGGSITAVTIVNGGSGFNVAPNVTISGLGTGAILTPTVSAGVITSVTIDNGGSGYTGTPVVNISSTSSYVVESDIPSSPFLFAIKHLDAFNDGVIIEFRADEKTVNGGSVLNDIITVRLRDPIDNSILHEFTGSLLEGAVDDFQQTYFLPDIVLNRTDSVEITVGITTGIEPNSLAYGYDEAGAEKWSVSGVNDYFSENGTAYTSQDFIKARILLQDTPHEFSYISSGGSQSSAMLLQLSQLSFDTNKQLRFDIDGSLSVSGAIAFVSQLNFNESLAPHLLHAFWTPLKSYDPTGINGLGFLGTATLNIAYSCLRNSTTNANGFPPKNYVIAGREWAIRRAGVRQVHSPSNQEFNSLAKARINPVVFISYTGGGRYVFKDSLTSASTNSLKKLIAVADMSTSIDDAITRVGNDIVQLPMKIAIKRMTDFLTTFFEQAAAPGTEWLVPSSAPSMGGKSFRFEVKANEVRPHDRMDVNYWLNYDGTVRQIVVSQTLSRV